MSDIKRPVEPEQISCEVCMKEIPRDQAQRAEVEDYVLHFCGIDCYAKWAKKGEHKNEAQK
jgi:hypothetical protein